MTSIFHASLKKVEKKRQSKKGGKEEGLSKKGKEEEGFSEIHFRRLPV